MPRHKLFTPGAGIEFDLDDPNNSREGLTDGTESLAVGSRGTDLRGVARYGC